MFREIATVPSADGDKRHTRRFDPVRHRELGVWVLWAAEAKTKETGR